jgi:TP53 regulating kinase-like protein
LLTYNNSNNIEEDILFHQEFDTFYFIDFGLSYVSQENEDKAVDLYVLRRAIISANPKSEEIFNQILEKYKIYVNNGNSIVNVLLKVEQRGRKKIAFG